MGRVRVTGLGPRVRSEYEKTRFELGPLPFLMEKFAFTLVTEACKLKPYFQAHTIVILTNKSLRRAMSNSEAVGRIALWAIELSEFDVQYCQHIAIKGQVVVDFIVESLSRKAGGQMSVLRGVSTQTDHSTNRLAERVLYSVLQKGTRLNAWFVLTSL